MTSNCKGGDKKVPEIHFQSDTMQRKSTYLLIRCKQKQELIPQEISSSWLLIRVAERRNICLPLFIP